MKEKLCIIYSVAPRYREAIFRLLDKAYNCVWYLGQPKTDIKQMNHGILKNVHFFKQYGNPSTLYWKSIFSALFDKTQNVYLVLLESRAISDYFFLLLKKCFFPEKRIYIWTHGLYGRENKIDKKLKVWQYNNVDGIFVYSNYSRNLLIKNGISENKVFTIHNSLHYNEQRALRESIRPSGIFKEYFGNGNPVIIFIGRLTKVKKLDMLVDAVSELREQGEEYNLVLVGDGIERDNLVIKVENLKMSNQVWFYGACYDEKTNAELIYNADLCVAPGNVGLTAMHTMVFGTPVISHGDFKWQMPEFEAILPGQTGDFFERDNLKSLVKSISHWFKSKSGKREEVREDCYKEIDTLWNPDFQMDVFKDNLF